MIMSSQNCMLGSWVTFNFELLHSFGKVHLHEVCFICLLLIFCLVFHILVHWPEARNYLAQAKKGKFQGVEQQTYGRGKRERVPKKIYTAPSVNARRKKIVDPHSSEDSGAGSLTETPYLTPPSALQ
jgi:hypothetical protein